MSKQFCYGIWLSDSREWATLPPRLRKPTPHNCDRVPALDQEAERLCREGRKAEVKEIDRQTLLAMRKEYR